MATVLVLALAGMLLSLVVPGVAQAWEQVGVPIGSPCPDVLVIGARGSGEAPQTNGGVNPIDYKNDKHNGMGDVTWEIYDQLHTAYPYLRIAHEGVQYAAQPVLPTDPTQPSLATTPGGYKGNVAAGARWMATEINAVYNRCKQHTKFVLAGYSQGAWLVHRVLNTTTDASLSTTVRNQVAGVVMFGDPLYVPNLVINRVNNEINTKSGSAYYWNADRPSAPLPNDILSKTGNYCYPKDPVCQQPRNPFDSSAHLAYVTGGYTGLATEFLLRFMPAPSPPVTAGDTPHTYGRNAPTYTSYPNDPTPTSKWVASAQGEDGLDPKGEVTSLRGRAAVQETFGIKRVRIYDVTLQRLVNGAWQTVAQRTADVVNESLRAYAVAYTPPKPLCRYGSGTRTYRVVNSHGVRRSDDVVADRVTYSKNFVSRMVEGDPGCPMGRMSIFPNGTPPPLMYRWQSARLATDLAYFSEGPTPAPGVVARVNFSAGIEVEEVAEGAKLDTSTADPNDYIYEGGSWSPDRVEQLVWHLMVTGTGKQSVDTMLSSSSSRVLPDRYVEEMDVTEIDVETIKSLPTDSGYNQDVDPSTEGVQLHPGDLVTYRFEVRNHGPGVAWDVELTDAWPEELGDITRAWYGDTEEPAKFERDVFDRIVWHLGDIQNGDAVVIYAQSRVDADAPTGWVPNDAEGDNGFDSNWDNNSGFVDFRVVPEVS